MSGGLAECVARARAEWSEIELPEEIFRAYLEERVPKDGDPSAAVAALHVTDLFLACACARGDERAVRAFEERAMTGVDSALRSLSADGDFGEEIRQRVREHLLVPREGAPPRIVEYAGRGPLARWVRIVAVRLGLHLLRGEKRSRKRELDLSEQPLAAGFDQELEYFRARYKKELQRAFEEALASLPSRERNVLQLHVLEGVSLSQIGALHRVNKSTVSRWLAFAREHVADQIREKLAQQLSLSEPEMSSLLRIFQSRFDLSISRIFHDDAK